MNSVEHRSGEGEDAVPRDDAVLGKTLVGPDGHPDRMPRIVRVIGAQLTALSTSRAASLVSTQTGRRRRPVQVLNLSRSGARIHDVVGEQPPRLAGLAPDLVTVAVGANDLKHYDAARFRADVDDWLHPNDRGHGSAPMPSGRRQTDPAWTGRR